MEKKERNTVYVLIAFGLIIGGIAAYMIYGSMNQPETGNQRPEVPNINRSLTFPRDEGMHDEISEIWDFYMNTSSGGAENDYFFVSMGFMNYKNGTIQYGISFSYTNSTASGVLSEQYNKFRTVSISNSSLDIHAVTEYGNTLNIKRTDDNPGIDSAVYSMYLKIHDENRFVLNLTLISERFAVPLGENGTADLGITGTVFGYMQPRFSLSGTVKIAGVNKVVTGSAMADHMWGVWSYSGFDFALLQMKNRDTILMRYYSSTGKIVVEYLYIIYENKYIEFITRNENQTIGVEVLPQKVVDLSGESYDVFIADYFMDPRDPYSHRCLPKTWDIYSSVDNYSLTFKPLLPPNYPDFWSWLEPVTARDSGGVGWGYAWLSHFSRSDITINNINIDRLTIEGNKYLQMNVSVSDGIPLSNVTLLFNYSGQHLYAPMQWDSQTRMWKAQIGPFSSGDTITFRIRVEDTAGKIKFFAENSITIN